jgi:hypothetical protein
MGGFDQADVDEYLRAIERSHGYGPDHFADRILDRLKNSVPEFFTDDVVAHDLRAATIANVAYVQEMLCDPPSTLAEIVLPLENRYLVHSTVHQGIPLASLTEAWRAAQNESMDDWLGTIERAVPAKLAARSVRRVSQLVGTYVERGAATVRASYNLDGGVADPSDDTRRSKIIRQLLAGELLDTDDAARQLDHPLTGTHIAVVLWLDDDLLDFAALDRALRQLSSLASPARTLSVAASNRRYAWFSGPAGGVDFGALCDARLPAGIGGAVSGVRRGAEGFVSAHRDAARVAQVARRRPSSHRHRLVGFEQFELLTILLRDEQASNQFVRRVLGPLADRTKTAQRRRITLCEFFAADRNRTLTAERLGVHRNTVGYRLESMVHEMPELGQVIVSDERGDALLEVEVALKLFDYLNPPRPH